MRREFEQYLLQNGYKKYTSKGRPSTVYDYIKRIDAVCNWEQMTWDLLARSISEILPEYEQGGAKAYLGMKSHNAVRCALRCFERFVKRQ